MRWVLATALLAPHAIFAQLPQERLSDTNFNGWYMYFGDHPIGGRWEVHLENQWRRHDGILKWQQNLFRPGVNYVLNERVTLTGGYANILSWPYGDHPSGQRNVENRIWEQATVTQRIRKVRFAHRFRQEQRWIREYNLQGDPLRWRYQNRFRYMAKATVPVKGKWFAAFYDEIFFNIAPNKRPRTLDENRAYVALGRRVGRSNSFEIGYLYQFVAQRNGVVNEHNHTLQFAWFSRTPFAR